MRNKEDLRRWPRHTFESPVKVTVDNKAIDATGIDLSEGGMKLIAPFSPKLDEQLQMDIQIENVCLKPLVKVRRVELDKESPSFRTLALQFLYLSHEEKRNLHKLLIDISR